MNTSHSQEPQALIGELLDDAALSLTELARACCVGPDWVVEHVEAGLLEGVGRVEQREWRFSSTTLVRARRMVHLEQGFDANPELAAFAADLIEEVTQLRRQLRLTGVADKPR